MVATEGLLWGMKLSTDCMVDSGGLVRPLKAHGAAEFLQTLLDAMEWTIAAEAFIRNLEL